MLDCWTGIEFLKVLQDIRLSSPEAITIFFRNISSAVFYLVLPIVLFLLMYWFMDKRNGEFCMVNAISAYMIANCIKYIVKQPRPYQIDPTITPTYEESSYSFPSGHTAIATAGYGSLIIVLKDNIIRAIIFIIVALTIFSRMWMGLHTPLDIIVAIVISLIVMAVNWYLLKLSYESERNYYAIGICYLVAFSIMVIAMAIMMDNDQKYNAMGSGFLLGVFAGRLVEHRYVGHEIPNYRTKNKIILGFVGLLVMMILIGLTYLSGVLILMFIGTFISMVWGMAVFPYLMKNKVSFFARFSE